MIARRLGGFQVLLLALGLWLCSSTRAGEVIFVEGLLIVSEVDGDGEPMTLNLRDDLDGAYYAISLDARGIELAQHEGARAAVRGSFVKGDDGSEVLQVEDFKVLEAEEPGADAPREKPPQDESSQPEPDEPDKPKDDTDGDSDDDSDGDSDGEKQED